MASIRSWPLLLIPICGGIGYFLAPTHTPPPLAPTSRTHSPSHPAHAAESVETTFADLLSNTGHETDVWRVVSRIPDHQLAEYRLQIQQQLASAPTESPEAQRLSEIESALFFRWAEIDPQAALAEVLAIPKSLDHTIDVRRQSLVQSVLAAWMHRDPHAAFLAVKDYPDFRYIGRDMIVQTWTPENVFQNAARYPENHRDLLGWYCVAAASNEEHRDAMLAAFVEDPDMQHGDWAKFMLFRS